MSATPQAIAPGHVPRDRIVDVDIYRLAGAEVDLQLAWKRIQDAVAGSLCWTPHNGGHWLVTRGCDIARIYADHEGFSSNITIVPREYGERYPLIPTTLDPPAHQPYRRLLNRVLGQSIVRPAAPIVRELAREAVARVQARGHCEFLHEVVVPIPLMLFLRLAGLPASDVGQLPTYAEDPLAEATPVMDRYANFLRPRIAASRRDPGEDLLSRIACAEVDGRTISEDDAVQVATAVLTGGLDTVVSALGLIMAFLARSPVHRAELSADPRRIERAVPELLRRFPIMTKARLLRRTQHIDGILVPAGDMIVLPPLHGLDEREFADPLAVEFDRPPAPNSTFGNGVHRCPGSLLAGAEIAIVVREWLARIPEFAIDAHRPPRMRSGILGAMLQLGLRWPTAARHNRTDQTSVHPGDPAHFADGSHWQIFARLRRTAPVHYCADSPYGPYWSITRYADIVATEKDHCRFSSKDNILINDVDPLFDATRAFATADPPQHTRERRAVSGVLAPGAVRNLEPELRGWIVEILDALPLDEPFDWMHRVAIEITQRMAARLFDFPQPERARLGHWAEALVTLPQPGALIETAADRQRVIAEYRDRMLELWHERAQGATQADVISALACDPATASMHQVPERMLGALSLIAGANEAARAALGGCVVAFARFPGQWAQLRAEPALARNAVAEIIRWQTPISHMRRTVTEDVLMQGQRLRAGDKVVLWYCSGNRDEAMFSKADELLIDRPNARQHMAFGFGIHRCLGRHVAELELRILLEECLQRFLRIELAGDADQLVSNFSSGYPELQVRVRR